LITCPESFVKYSLILIFFLFLNCNNHENPGNKEGNLSSQTSEQSKSNSDQQIGSAKNMTGCYMRVLKRDTLALHLQEVGNLVRGRLTFDNYEKDGSAGTVSGTIVGDVMKLIYSFQSEGMNSVMQVYFKISKNG
jgi:hypothetical protein